MSKRDLAAAYSAKRFARKSKDSAKYESRPMPSEKGQVDHDEEMEMKVQAAPARKGDSAIQGEDISMQAKRGGKFPLKHPKMVESILSTKLRQDEDDLMDADRPEYAKGGKVDNTGSHEKGVNRAVRAPALKGGMSDAGLHTRIIKGVKGHPVEHEAREDAIRAHKKTLEEMRSMPKPKLAEGGEIDMDEEELEHAASLAAAIMAKRKMARGGKILSEDSLESDDSDMADLDHNAQEDANMEDKASFDALRKENYSESDALDDMDQPEDSNEHGHEMEDEHDMSLAAKIRAKMKKRSPITE